MKLNYPLDMQIEITELCNHKCFYCYNTWQLNKSKNAYMTVDKAKSLTNIIKNEIKPFRIAITGGEPFLNLNALYELVGGLHKANIFVGINSNLTLVTPTNLENLINNTSARFGILTSLPHFKNEQYKFITGANDIQNFYTNMEHIINNTNVPLSVNMVVTKYNLKDVYSEAEFLAKKGINHFSATPVILPANINNSYKKYALSNEEIINVFETLLKIKEEIGISVDSIEAIPRCLFPEELRNRAKDLINRSCSAGRSTITIDYNGRVRACSLSFASVGSVFETDFSELWQRLSSYRNNENIPTECKSCEELLMCNGGCRCYDLQENDLLNKADPRMTQPIRTKMQKIQQKKYEVINPNEYYFLPKEIIYRKEKENLYTFFNGNFSNLIHVNEIFKNFITSLQKVDSFNINDLYSKTNPNIHENLNSLFSILLNNKFLKVMKTN
jgi:radical SAM protein with 4Fe4S-binding SPASM domain